MGTTFGKVAFRPATLTNVLVYTGKGGLTKEKKNVSRSWNTEKKDWG